MSVSNEGATEGDMQGVPPEVGGAANAPFDRVANPDPKDWPAVWKRKDEISSALLAELGYPVPETRILMRNAPARGELEVDGDVVVLLVCELNERGGLHLVRQEDGALDAVHEEVRVPVSAERLARYRADLDEAEASR